MPRRPARRRLAVVPLAALLAGLAAPVLGTPASAAPLPGPRPMTAASAELQKVVQLHWAPVAGAASYAVQVGTDPYWSDEADIFSLSTVSTRLTLPVWLPHADYLWRVAAVGADGVRGSWSATLDALTDEPLAAVTFTRGWQYEGPHPAEQRGGDEFLPTFRWEAVPTASEYQIQVSSNPDHADLAPHQQMLGATGSCFTTRTSVTPFNKQIGDDDNPGAGSCWFEGLDTADTLYWRVRALDQVADEVRELVTTPVADTGISYQPPSKAGSYKPEGCADSSSQVAGACEPSNAVEKGDWSEVGVWTRGEDWPVGEGDPRSLPVVDAFALPVETCSLARSCRDMPTLDWGVVQGASWYRVYIGLDAKLTNIQEIVETPGTSYTPTVQWRDSGVMSSYHYVVQACTDTGCGPVSTPQSFRKASVPVLLQAPDVTRTDTVLSWDHYGDVLAQLGEATSEAAAYRVQVTTAEDTSFSSPVEDVVTDHTSHASTTERYAEGDFLWRVQAIDASGHKLRWSAPGTFRRDFTAPVVALSSGLTSIDPRASVSITMSEAVTGVSSATAYLLPSSGGAAVPATVSVSAGKNIVVDPTGTLPAGGSYVHVLTSGIRDGADNELVTVKKAVTVNAVLDDANGAFTYAGTWTTPSSSMVSYGRYHLASAAGATATAATSGTGVRVYGCRGPSGGKLELRVDGVVKATVDTYSSYSSCGTLTEVTGLRSGTHAVQVRALGTRTSASKGTGVGLDGLRALR